MDFQLSEEQRMIIDTTKAFVENELYPHENEIEATGVLRPELRDELKKKAIEKDIYLSDDVVNLIAKCVKSNIRELEGCLIKLGAVTSILKVDIFYYF